MAILNCFARIIILAHTHSHTHRCALLTTHTRPHTHAHTPHTQTYTADLHCWPTHSRPHTYAHSHPQTYTANPHVHTHIRPLTQTYTADPHMMWTDVREWVIEVYPWQPSMNISKLRTLNPEDVGWNHGECMYIEVAITVIPFHWRTKVSYQHYTVYPQAIYSYRELWA